MERPALSINNCARVLTLHSLAVAGLFYYGWTWTAVAIAAFFYYFRHFAVAGFFHRYFSHRSFKTSRSFQFLMAAVGTLGGQKGPLSWATSHRLHHQHTEKSLDPHSPKILGFKEAYIGWILRIGALHTDLQLTKDFAVFPEIRWLDKFHYLGPVLFLIFITALGAWIENSFPNLQTTQMQVILWGFLISTLLNAHAAMTINTFCHLFGTRPHKTRDNSTNIWWLLPFVAGENWHNNHHAFPKMASSGIQWWELDPIYWTIKLLEKWGLVWDVVDRNYLEKNQISIGDT